MNVVKYLVVRITYYNELRGYTVKQEYNDLPNARRAMKMLKDEHPTERYEIYELIHKEI